MYVNRFILKTIFRTVLKLNAVYEQTQTQYETHKWVYEIYMQINT